MATTAVGNQAARIESECSVVYQDPNHVAECNWFVWKVAEAFFSGHSHGLGATKSTKTANQMVGWMGGGNGWARVTGADAGAIVDNALDLATQGNFVVAGMTSTQLGDPQHGHLAVVLRRPGDRSGTAGRDLPRGYAGSNKATARIPRDGNTKIHLGWSFPAAQWQQIGYWYRMPNAAPAAPLMAVKPKKTIKRKKKAPARKKARRKHR